MSTENPQPATAQIGDHVHVTPAEGSDLVMHTLDETCVCGPVVDPVQRADGSYGWVYVHHSLDNREAAQTTDPNGESR